MENVYGLSHAGSHLRAERNLPNLPGLLDGVVDGTDLAVDYSGSKREEWNINDREGT